MSNGKQNSNTKQLHHDMESVLDDVEHFLKDLKGQKRAKGLVRNDVRNLKVHLQRLTEHLNHMEAELPDPD